MRLWSIDPSYLDAKGLVALWRETLLAQNVLLGKTKGYTNHPQLERFKKQDNPIVSIGNYLTSIANEADKRGYNFNKEKIVSTGKCDKIEVTKGQIEYEFKHLLFKLKIRHKELFENYKGIKNINLNQIGRASCRERVCMFV